MSYYRSSTRYRSSHRNVQGRDYDYGNPAFGFSRNMPSVAPKLSDMAKLQAYAGNSHRGGIRLQHPANEGAYTWQLAKAAAKALGMKERDEYALSFIALERGRGATPMLCPEGAVCNAFHALGCTAEAEVGVYVDREYGFAFVCRAHINNAISFLRTAQWALYREVDPARSVDGRRWEPVETCHTLLAPALHCPGCSAVGADLPIVHEAVAKVRAERDAATLA